MTNSLNVGLHANAIMTLALSSGLFDDVQAHEAKNAPDAHGLHCQFHGARIWPVQSSGLASVSVRVEFQLDVMLNMLSDPADAIDPVVMNAAGEIMSVLAGGYTLNGIARDVDIYGADGEPMRAEAGYVTIGGGQASGTGGRMFRVMSVFIPIVINDVWDVSA